MTLDEFAALTKRVIARDGFDGFLPTACYPQKREIRALAELPSGVEIEGAVLSWAREHTSEGEEYLIAYKSGSSELTIVRHSDGQRTSGKFMI